MRRLRVFSLTSILEVGGLALIWVLFVGLSLVAWHWIYLFVALALLSVAYVLFGMKCYHLHEGYLVSLRK